MEKRLSRSNIGGLIFSCPEGAYRSVEAWFDAKAPSNALIYDTPAQLRIAGIPLVDAKFLDGIYFKARRKPPETSSVLLPVWCQKVKKGQTVNIKRVKLADLEKLDQNPKFHPSYVYYSEQVNRKGIGRSGNSKSKEAP